MEDILDVYHRPHDPKRPLLYGVANLFMMFAPLEGWRHVAVTDRRTAIDYAKILRDLSDIHFPDAEKIILVQDNLNTHKPASLYKAFPPAQARRLVERFEWHYTPKTSETKIKPKPTGSSQTNTPASNSKNYTHRGE